MDERAKLTIGHTARIERGERKDPGAETLRKLASALGVTIDFLVNGERAA